MKKLFYTGILFLVLLTTAFQGCTNDEEEYKPLPYAVYVANKAFNPVTNEMQANMTNSASARKTVSSGVFRVYVNQLSDKDVTVNFTVSGTAVAGENFVPPAVNSVTIPAGSYYGEVNFTVLNSPTQTANRTVIFTLTNATEGFVLGIGTKRGYSVFTYTITP